MRNDVVQHAKKAFKFLYLSRKGFYCALCGRKNHKFFLLDKKELISSDGFCGSMVEHSLNYFVFKFLHFPKISRLYSEFLIKCNMKGKYFPNRPLRIANKFYMNDKVVAKVISCKKMVKRKEAYRFCGPFCRMFNPVKYDKYLEGAIDKMFSLSQSLEHLIAKMKDDYKKDNKKDIIDIKRRILGSAPEDGLLSESEQNGLGFKMIADKSKQDNAATPTIKRNNKERILLEIPPMPKPKFKKPIKHMEEEDYKKENEITSFNREFKMALIKPIIYRFDEDLSIEHHVDYDSSIMKEGLDSSYNVVGWRMYTYPLGVDWYVEGKTGKINKGSAKQTFRKINPNDTEMQEISRYVQKNLSQ